MRARLRDLARDLSDHARGHCADAGETGVIARADRAGKWPAGTLVGARATRPQAAGCVLGCASRAGCLVGEDQQERTNDADGLAQIVRTGWYREVKVKSVESHLVRATLGARKQLVGMRTEMINQICGLMKIFGLILPKGTGARFEASVRGRFAARAELGLVIEPLLAAWRALDDQVAVLERQLVRRVRRHEVCHRLMTVPGVGPLTALAFVTTVDNPIRFRRLSSVGAYLGLTPRRHQSGERDVSGRISKCGDRLTRSYLFEAANVLLTRVERWSCLKAWALRLVVEIRRMVPGPYPRFRGHTELPVVTLHQKLALCQELVEIGAEIVRYKADMLKIEVVRLGRFHRHASGRFRACHLKHHAAKRELLPGGERHRLELRNVRAVQQRAVQRVKVVDAWFALGHADPHVTPRHAGIVDHPVAQRRMSSDHDAEIGLG
jgi:hypothetical protein